VVSHHLFEDDSLILKEADGDNARVLKETLDLYCASSGQLLSAFIYLVPILQWRIK
jgi:hypothetical protein